VQFGYFDDAAREYVITRPDTPLPWINYLGSDEYFGLISNTAGGYSFFRDARLRRLTRFRYNNVPLDGGSGRYLYFRDSTTREFWSPTWQPTRSDLDEYACRHGLGYTSIASRYRGIRAETLYLVPLHQTLEVWRTRITNQRATPADIQLFSAVEFCLWDATDDATNFQRNLSIGEVEVDGGVIYHKTEYRERRDHFAYFGCSEAVSGFDTQREAFLGAYRGWDSPTVVQEGHSANSIAHGWAPIGSHQVRLSLAPGESREVIFVLGYAENASAEKFDPPGSQILNKRSARASLDRYLDPAEVERAFDELRDYWTDLTSRLQVTSPDPHVNRMVNIWNAYQCMVTFNLSRSASYFESGTGRGMGFRDSNQDLLGFVHMIPARARERILDLAATQLPSGGAYHQYQPLTRRGNDAVGSGFNDDPLWLILAVAAYVKETGDLTILDEEAGFDRQPGSEASICAHLQRSLAYTLERLGPHGLPLIGRADWNDCLNLNCFSETPGESFQTTQNRSGGVAESVFIAGLFVLAADDLAALARLSGHADDADAIGESRRRMQQAVVEHGWDGDWFLRAYDFFGGPVGSSANAEGKIFAEPQGICVMAGIGLEDGRAERALASVDQQLKTPHGVMLLQPAFSRYYPELGEISSYPPGYKENASIFCHTNPWITIAQTRLGQADQAFESYIAINPSAREPLGELHRCEPYVYAQTIAGRDGATHGEAKNSWLTGTAAWCYVAISQWILGIRADYEGLRVEPCIPSGWSGFTATRVFRGATYRINVRRNTDRGLVVGGRRVEGSLVPLAAPGSTVDVDVSV
jgi:cellobiose phosphorylase